MRRALAGLASLALVLAACGRPAAGTSTTSSSTTTSSTTTSTTATSTSTTSTTTTVPSTTTTSGVGPGTTAVPGNWADLPLIVASWGAVGWWAGSGWVSSFTELPVAGGEDYQVVSVSGSGIVQGGPQTEMCEPVMNLGVELSQPEKLGEWPGPSGVAVSAPWFVHPHLFEVIANTAPYAGFASELLASRGMTVPSPIIKQAYRTDLEGDGVHEVLVVAEKMTEPMFAAFAGDYSIVFLRKVVDGEVQTAVLATSIHPTDGAEGEIPYSYGIGGVGDLNGDGKMEIVVSGRYYEGEWVEIWEYVNDDLGPMKRLEAGCGA